MKTIELVNLLNYWCSFNLAENFDNVGLLVGDQKQKISGVLITLDCIESVIKEAIKLKFNTIITFHPIIFNKLKTIIGDNYVEQSVILCIKNSISVICIHTNLDNMLLKINNKIYNNLLELHNLNVLIPKEKKFLKLITYIPESHVKIIQNALFNVGVGVIGNYTECSYSFKGEGTFKPLKNTNPFIGEKFCRKNIKEICFNGIFDANLKKQVINILQKYHPYEEVVYEIIKLENKELKIGMGQTGELKKEIDIQSLLHKLKKIFNCSNIRYSSCINKKIKKIGFIGGSGSFSILSAIELKLDVLITSDLTYHDFFLGKKIVLIDIGHYESENFIKNIIFNFLKEKNVNFAFQISNINTNPVNYF